MGPFRRYIVQRLVASGLTLLGVSCIIFLMVRLLPGDPARVIAGLLASELIARKAKDFKPFVFIFFEDAFQGFILRSQAAFGGHVDNQQDFAFVRCQ